MPATPRFLIPLVILIFGASRGVQRILTGLALPTVDAWTITAFSLALATLVWFPIAWKSGWLRKDKALWTASAPLAVVNIVIPGVAFTAAQQFITASATALLVATLPLVIAIFAAIILREHLTSKMVGGLLLGSAGVVLLVLGKGGEISGGNWLVGAGLTGLGVVSAAAVYVGWRTLLSKYSATVLLGPQLAISTALAGIAALIFGSPISLPSATDPAMLILLTALAVVNYILPQLAMFWLLTRTTAVRSSIANYLAPLFATGLGAIFLHQSLTWTIATSGVFIIAGAAVLNYAKATRRS